MDPFQCLLLLTSVLFSREGASIIFTTLYRHYGVTAVEHNITVRNIAFTEAVLFSHYRSFFPNNTAPFIPSFFEPAVTL
jgi:hypothetical protein